MHTDEMDLFAGINTLCLYQNDSSPSPMPPKVNGFFDMANAQCPEFVRMLQSKVLQNTDIRTRTSEEEKFVQMCDAIVVRAIVSIVNSFGHGPLEQGRFVCPLKYTNDT